jgi:tetraacyldisaccharide 4'-kinase
MRSALARALWDVWFPHAAQQPPRWARALVWLAHPVLLVLSALVRVVADRRALAQPLAQRLPLAPVVSVGNAIVGGTGKTPAVLLLIDLLRQAGLHPGVVSRGYGRQKPARVLVLKPEQLHGVDARVCGDEPWLIAWRSGAPVAVAIDRFVAAQALLAADPKVNVIVLDDGLSQNRLAVDHHLLVVDHRGHGNQRCLPAGPLRMDWPGRPPTGLQIDAVLLRDPSLAIGDLFSRASVQPAILTPQTELSGWFNLSAASTTDAKATDPAQPALLSAPTLSHARLVLTTIANPQAFHHSLRQQGLDWQWQLSLADHSPRPWQALTEALTGRAKTANQLLMTEKDAVKFLSAPDQLDALRETFTQGVWVLRQSLRLDPAQSARLMDRLITLKGASIGSQTA